MTEQIDLEELAAAAIRRAFPDPARSYLACRGDPLGPWPRGATEQLFSALFGDLAEHLPTGRIQVDLDGGQSGTLISVRWSLGNIGEPERVRARAKDAGATFNIKSHRTGGATVFLFWPLRPA